MVMPSNATISALSSSYDVTTMPYHTRKLKKGGKQKILAFVLNKRKAFSITFDYIINACPESNCRTRLAKLSLMIDPGFHSVKCYFQCYERSVKVEIYGVPIRTLGMSMFEIY